MRSSYALTSATFVISADGAIAKVIASEFDMTVHAHAARESSQNPDEQGT